MENIFAPKIPAPKKDSKNKMEMRSLTMDKEKIEIVKPYFNLKSTLQGSNEKILKNGFGTTYSINNVKGLRPAEVLAKVLNVSGTGDSYIGSFNNSEDAYIPGSLAKKVRELPKPQKELLNLLIQNRNEQDSVKQNVEQVNQIVSILQGSNEKILKNGFGTTYSINNVKGLRPAEVLAKVLNVSGTGDSYIGSFNNSEDAYIPGSLAKKVRELPQEVRRTFTQYITSQYDKNVKPNIDEFDKIRREYAIQQSFWKLIETKPTFEKLTEFISDIEAEDSKDNKLIQDLTNYAFQYRRQNFLDFLFKKLAQEKPDFNDVLEQVKRFSQSPSQVDKDLLALVAEISIKYELLKNKEDIIFGIDFNTPAGKTNERINALPLRPKIGNVDPTIEIAALKEKIASFYEVITPLQSLDTVTAIREQYTSKSPKDIFKSIDALPATDNYQIETKNILLKEYEDYLSAKSQMTTDVLKEIQKRIQPIFDEEYNMVELGKNEPAKKYLMENFSHTFFPLFQSLRGNPTFKNKLEDYIVGKDEQGMRKRLQFVQELKALEKQRPLTDIERTYIESIEQLTKFNPYLVALSNEALGETNEYLRNHFDTLSAKTWNSLLDGGYVPMLQIGSGPNGLAFFGEIARYRPDLAKEVLLIDIGSQPGGPFAIPNGPAWELNSANRRGPRQAVMPDAPGPSEKKKIRAFGSPVSRWYPGERKSDQNVRQGSINTTVDYFPTPDDLSTLRYPTNEELQIILAIQSAMLFRQATFETRLVKVTPNTNKNKKGDKIVTLEKMLPNGEVEIKEIYTDAIINSSGLGEPFYGFKIEGSRAEELIEKTKDLDSFPKFSDTLTAFKALADRKNDSMKPPRVIAMSGAGNSTDVLIEYLAELFASGNSQVRNVEKIYIIAAGELSQRPRYSKINDVKSRNGKDNLIEFVKARIGDVGFKDEDTENPKDEQVVIYDEKNKPIKDEDGNIITADAFIANSGFKPKFDQIYEDYLDKGESLILKSTNRPVEQVTLPTNKEITVADQLKKDPNIVFVGTASNPDFGNFDKLAQLPVEAREALLRNGVENAVAIGFRAPDSQAAARIFIDKREIKLPESTEENVERVMKMEKVALAVTSWETPILIDPTRPRVSDNVYSEDDMLSALMVYNLGFVELEDQDGKPMNGEYTFEVKMGSRENTLRVNHMNDTTTNPTLIEMVNEMLSNTYIQNYALAGFKKKRLNPKLSMVLKFRNGKIDPRASAIQLG